MGDLTYNESIVRKLACIVWEKNTFLDVAYLIYVKLNFTQATNVAFFIYFLICKELVTISRSNFSFIYFAYQYSTSLDCFMNNVGDCDYCQQHCTLQLIEWAMQGLLCNANHMCWSHQSGVQETRGHASGCTKNSTCTSACSWIIVICKVCR